MPAALAGCLLTIDDGLVDRARDAGADASSSGCPAGAVFCDDFESGGLSKWTWRSDDLATYASVVDDPTAPGNRVLRIDAPAMDHEWSTMAADEATVAPSSDLELSFRLFVSTAIGEIFPFGVTFANDYQVAYRLGSSHTLCEQRGKPLFFAYDVPKAPSGAWSSVRIAIHRAKAYADVAIGSSSRRVPASGTLVGGGDLTTTKLTMVVGVFYAPKDASWSGLVDDVVVRSL